jgi:hypothetical protein
MPPKKTTVSGAAL